MANLAYAAVKNAKELAIVVRWAMLICVFDQVSDILDKHANTRPICKMYGKV